MRRHWLAQSRKLKFLHCCFFFPEIMVRSKDRVNKKNLFYINLLPYQFWRCARCTQLQYRNIFLKSYIFKLFCFDHCFDQCRKIYYDPLLDVQLFVTWCRICSTIISCCHKHLTHSYCGYYIQNKEVAAPMRLVNFWTMRQIHTPAKMPEHLVTLI